MLFFLLILDSFPPWMPWSMDSSSSGSSWLVSAQWFVHEVVAAHRTVLYKWNTCGVLSLKEAHSVTHLLHSSQVSSFSCAFLQTGSLGSSKAHQNTDLMNGDRFYEFILPPVSGPSSARSVNPFQTCTLSVLHYRISEYVTCLILYCLV